MTSANWKVWVDTGGTFTDCIAIDSEGKRHRVKVLSSSALRGTLTERLGPRSYRVDHEWSAPNDFIAGFHFRLLDREHRAVEVTSYNANRSMVTLDRSLQTTHDIGASFEVVSEEASPVLAARLVTATPAGETLPPIDFRLSTTKGTNALLERTGAPTALFVTKGYADLLDIGRQERPDLFALDIDKPSPLYERVVEVDERLNADGSVHRSLDTSALEAQVEDLLDAGIESAAIAFLHSYKNSAHEEQVAEVFRRKGMAYVSVSSHLSSSIKIIPRAETALVNAYLAPVIDDYLEGVRSHMSGGRLDVMTSAGGIVHSGQFRPKDSLLSGPAAGVVGAAAVGESEEEKKVFSFDMGGTSTDVARYDEDFEYVFEHEVGDAHLAAPAVAIETVAAGGGSICSYDGHSLQVGPESAGAFPGPACYGAGGPLTVTDVNLLLGRLDPLNFHIPVAREEAQERFDELVAAVQADSDEEVDERELLEGFADIANERMAKAIRTISLRKGYDPQEYALVPYGGAGGQHACAIARRLGIERILLPTDAGVLSAHGLGNASREHFAEQQVLEPLHAVEGELSERMGAVAETAKDRLRNEGVAPDRVEVRRQLVCMRLEGQEATLEIEYEGNGTLRDSFKEAYKQHYGHWISDRNVEVESLRAIASTQISACDAEEAPVGGRGAEPIQRRTVQFDGRQLQTPVYWRTDMTPGERVKGPALVLDPHSTVVVEPGWEGVMQNDGLLRLEMIEGEAGGGDEGRPEAVRVELFINRFSSIAEEMGNMFQRTALSVNVKERLDFSCGLLSPEGELVVNAPHIPVHLGALGLCVRAVLDEVEMGPGDVVVTNHPNYGGAHLPDVTVITPIHTDDEQLIGYAASRAHHAEIGGTRPGSVPPNATRLEEEGVVIPPTYLLRDGEGQWDAIRRHLLEAPHPTRSIEENITDLQAAVAANHRGAEQLRALVGEHGIDEVTHYMGALKQHAADKMRETIRSLPSGDYESVEYLDDGSALRADIHVNEGHIDIDFSGTADEHPGNLNATPAIVNSVVVYVLRVLIDEPLPLNEGILAPIDLDLPRSLLNPDFVDDPGACPAVVGGNVETSQRLTDTLLKPFGRVACSEGTMNNVIFGNDSFGYYETVGGGTGAGSDFDGTDAVHHHMTNTRATDPEVFEHRYPVRLDRYAIREGSGGRGAHDGGNGIVREMTFLEPVSLSVLTQHRTEKPYGLRGGGSGSAGGQWVVYQSGLKEKLDSIDGRELEAGDRFILRTPGGGGFGSPDAEEVDEDATAR